MNMFIVSTDLVGYNHSPSVNPAERCDRPDAVDIYFVLEISHAYLRDFCCVRIRSFDERCTAFSVLVPNQQKTDLELGARVAESGYSGPEQFLYVFLLVFSYFPIVNAKVFPVVSHAVKENEGLEVQLHTFLTWVLDGVSYQFDDPAALRPVKAPTVSFEQKGAWVPETV
jgi:hypothetical protein